MSDQCKTLGFVDIFDETSFFAQLDQAFDDPLTLSPGTMAHLHLVLAAGMCLATPQPASPEEAILEDVRRNFPNQAEVYYLVATRNRESLRDVDQLDLGNVQSLVLMAFYMLLRTRRSLAYAYIGESRHTRSGRPADVHQGWQYGRRSQSVCIGTKRTPSSRKPNKSDGVGYGGLCLCWIASLVHH